MPNLDSKFSRLELSAEPGDSFEEALKASSLAPESLSRHERRQLRTRFEDWTNRQLSEQTASK